MFAMVSEAWPDQDLPAQKMSQGLAIQSNASPHAGGVPSLQDRRPRWSGRPGPSMHRSRAQNVLRERVRGAQRPASRTDDQALCEQMCKENQQSAVQQPRSQAQGLGQQTQTRVKRITQSGWVLKQEWNEVLSTSDWRRRWAVLSDDFFTLSRLQGGPPEEKHETRWINLVNPADDCCLEIGDRFDNFVIRTRHTQDRDNWNSALRLAAKLSSDGAKDTGEEASQLLSPTGKRARG
eukprot:CAMPEP_0184291444 /NCGR_PEP_ID=MMETSP1049-20130417/3483_1 /TAXON_ID=77928 /ORGANISM="Proteomonas sulcata, Strain CCMP704" /LENGTH=235 /DNA_ID=CAMNT_0026598909 /DNA_START=57 /DNA_END=764 /DNA_ORIENTATION=-